MSMSKHRYTGRWPMRCRIASSAGPVGIEVIEGHDRVADLTAEFQHAGHEGAAARANMETARHIQQTFLRGAVVAVL